MGQGCCNSAEVPSAITSSSTCRLRLARRLRARDTRRRRPRSLRARERALCRARRGARLVPACWDCGVRTTRVTADAARNVAAQLLNWPAETGSHGRILGTAPLRNLVRGRFAAARAHLQQLLAFDSRRPDSRSAAALHPCVSGRAWLALTLSVSAILNRGLRNRTKRLPRRTGSSITTHGIVLGLRCSSHSFSATIGRREARRESACPRGRAGFAYWQGSEHIPSWAQASAGNWRRNRRERRGLARAKSRRAGLRPV